VAAAQVGMASAEFLVCALFVGMAPMAETAHAVVEPGLVVATLCSYHMFVMSQSAAAGMVAGVVVVVVEEEEEEEDEVLKEGELTEMVEGHEQLLPVHELETVPLANA